MKEIVFSLLICSFGFALNGQVVIAPIPHQEGYYSLDDIWRVNLISTQTQMQSVQLEVKVEDDQHQIIFTAISPMFNLFQGSNRPYFNANSIKVQYGAGTAMLILRSTGRFPYGNYIICYNVLSSSNNLLLGEFCQEEVVLPLSPPELVSPYKQEVVNTTMPILNWKAPFPQGEGAVLYSLRLVELNEQQDALQALESNPLLINQSVLYGTSLPYPAEAPKLEYDKHYAWQVSARSGSFDLGVTEVWSFSIKNDRQKREAVIGDSYRMVKNRPDGNFYIANKGQLRFSCDNRFGDTNLRYTIKPTDGVGRIITASLPTIELVDGMNKVDIDLSKNGLFQENSRYVLELIDGQGIPAYFEFVYHSK